MRRAHLQLLYEGKDISDDIGPDMISFTFTDKFGGDEADDAQLVISDRDRLWQDAWLPERGHILRPTITCVNWFDEGDSYSLPCGEFQVDEVEFEAGEADKVTVKGVPAAVKSSIAGQKKTRAWQGTNLMQVATDIAGGAGLAVEYHAEAVPLNRIDQRQESDLGFLSRLAKENGCRVKVADGKLVVLSGATGDGFPAVELDRGMGGSFRGKIVTAEVYSGCDVTFMDPASGKNFKYEYRPDGAPKTGKVLTVNRRGESMAHVQQMAKAALRDKNAGQMTGEWSGMGDPRLRAGGMVSLSGFGKFSVSYRIKEVTHTVTAESYTTSASLESVLGY